MKIKQILLEWEHFLKCWHSHRHRRKSGPTCISRSCYAGETMSMNMYYQILFQIQMIFSLSEPILSISCIIHKCKQTNVKTKLKPYREITNHNIKQQIICAAIKLIYSYLIKIFVVEWKYLYTSIEKQEVRNLLNNKHTNKRPTFEPCFLFWCRSLSSAGIVYCSLILRNRCQPPAPGEHQGCSYYPSASLHHPSDGRTGVRS